jgi:hypothetical protein
MEQKVIDVLRKLVTHAHLPDPLEKEELHKALDELQGDVPQEEKPAPPPTYEELLAKWQKEQGKAEPGNAQ